MKRVIYIGIAVFALGMVSCSKQDVTPNCSSDPIVPSWKSGGGDVTDPELGGSDGGTLITDPELGGSDGTLITDPELGG